MDFDTFEISDHDARPIFYYKFRYGATFWYFTSTSRNLVYAGNEHERVAISHDDLRVGGDSDGTFEIHCQPDLAPLDLFRGTPPSEEVVVTIYKEHVGEVGGMVIFIGRIANVKRGTQDGDKSVTLVCRQGRRRRGGLRLTWGRTCSHIVYDHGCKVDKADFAHTATVQSVDGVNFTLTAAPVGAAGTAFDGVAMATVGWFDGGIVSWDVDGLGTLEQRMIEAGASTTTFAIFGRTDGLEAGTVVTMYPGCDQLASTCDSKFNNLVNLGGIPQMMTDSPFDKNIF